MAAFTPGSVGVSVFITHDAAVSTYEQRRGELASYYIKTSILGRARHHR